MECMSSNEGKAVRTPSVSSSCIPALTGGSTKQFLLESWGSGAPTRKEAAPRHVPAGQRQERWG